MRSKIPGTYVLSARRIAATIALLGGATYLPLAAFAAHAQTGAPPAKTAHVAPVTAVPAQGDFAAMVDRYGPAVVNISAAASSAAGDQTEQPAATPGLDNVDPDDPLFTLLRANAAQPPTQPAAPDAPRVVWGTGSGFIISPDGLVVTTAHVVNRADQVTVTLTDKRQLKADVLAVDPQTDIALLQIDHASKLPVLRLGDSSRARIGERVLAIGAPDGPQNTVASGLVSVMPHLMPDGNTFPFLETDLAAQPDNSGGPILDRNGTVIGVDVQVYADSGRFRNVALAIPIEAAIKLRAQLQEQGKLAGGSLGAHMQDVDPGLAAAFGLPNAMGALVTDVAPSARGNAGNGLKPGDVVTRINGKPIEHVGQLNEYVSVLQPGSKVVLSVVRNKKPMTLTTTVVASRAERGDRGDRADRADRADRGAAAGAADTSVLDRLGLIVRPLSEAEKSAGGLPDGVAVDGVTGAAASAGLQVGDVILSVNSESVNTQQALERAIARGGKEVALLIQRDNARSFVSLPTR